MKNIIIGVLVLIIIGVGTWGFYNGYKIKTYAKEVKSIINQSTSKWTYNQITIKGYNSKAEMEADINLVVSDSKEQLAKLDNLKSSSKTAVLEKKTRDYFNTAQSAGMKAQELLNTNAFTDLISTPLVTAEQEVVLLTYPDQIKSEAENLQKSLFSWN